MSRTDVHTHPKHVLGDTWAGAQWFVARKHFSRRAGDDIYDRSPVLTRAAVKRAVLKEIALELQG